MTSSQESPSHGAVANRSLVRGVRILEALAGSEEALTVTEVARRVDLPRATVFRLLATLEDEGVVDRRETTYSLGWRLAQIARTVDPAAGLAPRIKDLIDGLAEATGETATFSLRRGTFELDVVAESQARRLGVSMFGMTWPHHATAQGKLLLAELTPEQVDLAVGQRFERLTEHTITTRAELNRELDRVRQQGWAGMYEELEDGAIAFGAPVRDSVGTLIGVLALVGPVHRMQDPETQGQLVARLLAVADKVQRRMGSSAPE